MTEQEYQQLNSYLNDYMQYLDIKSPIFKENIDFEFELCLEYKKLYEKYKMNELNPIVFDETYVSTLELIEETKKFFKEINCKENIDELIQNGFIDLETTDQDDIYYTQKKDACSSLNRDLHINLNHNVMDIPLFIHEYFHYLNKKNPDNKIYFAREYLSEFISIFFENYYLYNLGDNRNYFNGLIFRINNTYCCSVEDFYFSKRMIMFETFGNLSDKSYEQYNELFKKTKSETKENFEKNNLYTLELLKQKCHFETKFDYLFGFSLWCYCKHKIGIDEAYIKKMLKLNDNLEYSIKSVGELLKSIDIDMSKENILDEFVSSIEQEMVEIKNIYENMNQKTR